MLFKFQSECEGLRTRRVVPPTDCMGATHIGEGNVLSQSTDSSMNLIPKTPTQTHTEYCLTKYLGTLGPSQVDT